MEKGQVVQIFQDPITRQDLEGRATLVEYRRYMGDSVDEESCYTLERWLVRFTSEEGAWERNIRVDYRKPKSGDPVLPIVSLINDIFANK